MKALLKPRQLLLIATALSALAVLMAGTPPWSLDAAIPHLASIESIASQPVVPAGDVTATLTQDVPILAVLVLGIGGLLWIRRHTFHL